MVPPTRGRWGRDLLVTFLSTWGPAFLPGIRIWVLCNSKRDQEGKRDPDPVVSQCGTRQPQEGPVLLTDVLGKGLGELEGLPAGSSYC